MNDPLGWDYPAGAEYDKNAPWNQKDDAPDEERDMDDASDEECGNLTSPSALAALNPTPLPNGMADLPSFAGFPSAGVSFPAVSLPSETMPMRVGEDSVVFGVVAPIDQAQRPQREDSQ